MTKIVTVCGFGIGTSLILKMYTEKALANMNIEAEVQCTDKLGASSLPCHFYLTSNLLAEELSKEVSVPIVIINNAIDVNEITTKVKAIMIELSLLEA